MQDKKYKYKRMTFSFTEADADIVAYLEKLKKSGKASEFVREAIREKISNIDNKDKELEAKIKNIVEEILSKNSYAPPASETNQKYKQSKTDDKLDDAILNAIDLFEF